MTPRTLILVELKGGNEGLNTVIPYADPHYRELRGSIALPRERTLQLDERVGLHDKLAPLMESRKAKDLAILQGVGDPYPNRSHFRSIEIWDTASASSQTLSEGWVAQTFQGAVLAKGAGVDGIVVDTNSVPLTGPSLRTIVMQDAENFLRQAQAMKDTPGMADGGNPALRHLLAVRHEVNAAAAGLRDKLRDTPQPAFAYGEEGGLGRQLDLATRLVLARVPVVAIKVALGGFDTHANQTPTQERLLGILPGEQPGAPAQEPDGLRPVERCAGHDLLGIRPACAAQRQRRHRSRCGGAAFRHGWQGQGRPARCLPVAHRPAGR